VELRTWEVQLHTAAGSDPQAAGARQPAAAVDAGLDDLAADPGRPGLRARVGQDLEAPRRGLERAGRR